MKYLKKYYQLNESESHEAPPDIFNEQIIKLVEDITCKKDVSHNISKDCLTIYVDYYPYGEPEWGNFTKRLECEINITKVISDTEEPRYLISINGTVGDYGCEEEFDEDDELIGDGEMDWAYTDRVYADTAEYNIQDVKNKIEETLSYHL